MNVRKDEQKPTDNIPDLVVDATNQKKYIKGKFMGKGGFAKCYELTDVETKFIYAGKVVSKDLLIKPHQKEKMSQEIAIHKSISHKHIVKFHGFFEDIHNVYILLELCRRRSLMELQRRRRTVTEPEARYFVQQIAIACDYLHQKHIIHRDLKLGNLFLNEEMEVKIGDFGLATRIDKDGERKKTLCGTPNYIAPEILAKKGHSYEVDAWSLGCILFTLIIGKPPFETSNLKDTYARIKRNEYYIPHDKCSVPAKNLIEKLLQSEPTRRPTMAQVLKDEFLVSGFMPLGLPTSCLTTAPHISTLKYGEPNRLPLSELNEPGCSPMMVDHQRMDVDAKGGDGKKNNAGDDEPADYYLADLMKLLDSVVSSKALESNSVINIDEAEDPAAVPIYWVSKWVDYSDKYGLGYQLCDNSIGVLYNDSTRLILSNNAENIQYIEKDGSEVFHTLKQFPQSLTKKVTLLKYFRNYMSEHLIKAGSNITPRDGDDMCRLPFLRTWFRTRSAIVLHLSNGTLQINFFHDHTKIILCPLMGAVTYIDETQQVRTFRLPLIEKFGCQQNLASRLRYAKTMVEKLTTGCSGRSANIK